MDSSASPSSDPVQNEIIEEFDLFDGWDDKYSHIIACGKALDPLPQADMVPENLVHGCQSSVWIVATVHPTQGVLCIRAWSDALIVRGIIALLLRVLDGRPPQEVRTLDLYFVEAVGLNTSLSMTRGNGLRAMVKKIRLLSAEAG